MKIACHDVLAPQARPFYIRGSMITTRRVLDMSLGCC
jgi:hypothetical protein